MVWSPVGDIARFLGMVDSELLYKFKHIFPSAGISRDSMVIKDFKVCFVINFSNRTEQKTESIDSMVGETLSQR